MIASTVNQTIQQKPAAPIPIFENAPSNLVNKKIWVLWRYELDGARWTKPPCQVNSAHASVSDPDTWATFEEVKTAYEQGGFDGVGFVLDGQDGLKGIDLDHIIESGDIKGEWKQVLDRLDSYSEVSPSGEGAHCIVYSKHPLVKNKCKNGDIELYEKNVYLTFTGDLIPGYSATIEDRSEELKSIYDAYFAPSEDSIPQREEESEKAVEDDIPHLEDSEVIRTAERLNGDKFKHLMVGQWEDLGYKSSSEARMALLFILAYYCDGSLQIDRVFRKSGMYRLCKDGWPRLAEMEIGKAMTGCKGHYRPRNKENENRLSILVNYRSLWEVVSESLQALVGINDPPQIFQRGRILCRVVRDENNLPAVEPLSEAALRTLLSRAAEYVQITQSGRKEVYPPREVVQSIMSLEELPIPHLKGITNVPIIRSDGTICTEPGYDPVSGFYYDGSLEITLHENPTQEDAKEAAKYILDEVLHDFPFDNAGRANAFAGILTPVIRPYIRGQVPLLIINKSTPGTGASLYMDCVYSIIEGVPANMSSLPKNEEEIRKQITSALFKGTRLVCFDNQDDKVESGTLSRALTSTIWEDRLLGQTKMLSLKQQTCWYITGNNVILGGDLPRRCYECYMDAHHPRPWERTGFRHENLRAWVTEHRPELVSALMTMTKAWVSAGQPSGKSGKKIGSFEEWVKVIDGILTYAGVEGFLGNLRYDEVDTDAGEWGAFLVALYKATEGEPFTSNELVTSIMDRHPNVKASLPSKIMEMQGKPGSSRSIGIELKKKENRRYEAGDDHKGMDYMIVVSIDKHTKINCYQVKLAERGQKTLV